MRRLAAAGVSCLLLGLVDSTHFANSQDAVLGSQATSTPQQDSRGKSNTATQQLVADFDVFLKHLDQGNYAQAAAQFEKLATAHWSDLFWTYAAQRLKDGRSVQTLKESLGSFANANPNDPALHRLSGYLSLLDIDVHEAFKQFDQAIQLQPTNAVAFSMRGQCWRIAIAYLPHSDRDDLHSQSRTRSLEDLTQAIRLDPQVPAFYLTRALQRINDLSPEQLGDTERIDREMLEDLAMARGLGYDPCQCSFLQGQFHSELQNHRAAVHDSTAAISTFERQTASGQRDQYVDFEHLLQRGSILAKSYFFRSQARIHIKDYQGALDDLNATLKLCKNCDEEFYAARAEIYIGMKNFHAALSDLNTAAQKNPAFDNNLLRAWIKLQLQDYQAALDDYNIGISPSAIYPRTEPYDMLTGRGIAKHHLGDTQGALKDFNAATKRSTPGPFVARGRLYFDIGDIPKALADYDQAIALDSRCVNAYTERAILRIHLREFKAALADYDTAIKTAIQLDDQSIQAITGKSFLLSTCSDASLRDPAAASELANRAADIDPEDPYSLNARACADAVSGNFASAIALEEKALRFARFANNKDFDGADYAQQRITAWKSNQLWTIPDHATKR